MSKSNPLASPDAPNYEVVGNMIHRYEPMDISEAFGALSQVQNPLCGFRDADFQPWFKGRLNYVYPTADEPFRTTSNHPFKQCARITLEDPRKVPEGVPELPEPWLAYVGTEQSLPAFPDEVDSDGPYWIFLSPGISDKWICGSVGNAKIGPGIFYAIDVRTAFAREHFPEYVEALGYPTESTIADAVQKVCAEDAAETDDGPDEATALENALKQVTPELTAREIWSHLWQSGRDYERANSRDTQLLDKLAETEMKLENGSQLWEVFTDRDDLQMTLREAIEAWGADE